jgi:hypothetical protein
LGRAGSAACAPPVRKQVAAITAMSEAKRRIGMVFDYAGPAPRLAIRSMA